VKIIGLHHAQITVPRGQETNAREFYCGVLGLVEIPKADSLKGMGGLWMQAGDRAVHIGVEDNVNRNVTKAHLAYEVDDVSAWRNKLREQGLATLDSIAIPGFDRFEFRDPFGNRVELIQKT
jgi:catechol 2,3-dioxygenase-like lactoylglutathione lyase family enzyme